MFGALIFTMEDLVEMSNALRIIWPFYYLVVVVDDVLGYNVI